MTVDGTTSSASPKFGRWRSCRDLGRTDPVVWCAAVSDEKRDDVDQGDRISRDGEYPDPRRSCAVGGGECIHGRVPNQPRHSEFEAIAGKGAEEARAF